MELEWLPYDLTVCKVESMDDIDFGSDVFLIGKTDQELSAVCPTQTTSAWCRFRLSSRSAFC